MAIYGKLDATSRGEAVDHAVDAGLLEPFAVAPPGVSSFAPDAAGRGA